MRLSLATRRTTIDAEESHRDERGRNVTGILKRVPVTFGTDIRMMLNCVSGEIQNIPWQKTEPR